MLAVGLLTFSVGCTTIKPCPKCPDPPPAVEIPVPIPCPKPAESVPPSLSLPGALLTKDTNVILLALVHDVGELVRVVSEQRALLEAYK